MADESGAGSQLEKIPIAWPSVDVHLLHTQTEVQRAGKEIMPCAGQEGERSTASATEQPWSWESDHLALLLLWGRSFMSLGKEPRSSSYPAGLLQGFLSMNLRVSWCYWVPRKTNTHYTRGQMSLWKELSLRSLESSVTRVGKKGSKFWNSLKVNHYIFSVFFLSARKVHNKKLCPIPSLTSPSTWLSPHPWTYSILDLTPFLNTNPNLTFNLLLTLPILGFPNPELHPIRDRATGKGWN